MNCADLISQMDLVIVVKRKFVYILRAYERTYKVRLASIEKRGKVVLMRFLK